MTTLHRLTTVLIALLLSAAPGVLAAPPETGVPGTGIDGSWRGTLRVGPAELRLLFSLQATDGNAVAGSINSPDQGSGEIPLAGTWDQSTKVDLLVAALDAAFKGALNDDGSAITGTWIQGGQDLPLTLKRLAQARSLAPNLTPSIARPQNPTPPYPYQATEVRFTHPTGGFELAGTLTAPAGPGPHPAAILLSGSGPQDRDESLLGHRPFLVLADHLTRHGIAVLRYDDRGFGESGGDHFTSTTADFATDVLAALAHLRTRPDIDPQRIGLIGHSEGALMGPLAAAERPGDIAYLMLLAGPGVPLAELLQRQAQDVMRSMGVAEDTAARAQRSQREMLALLQSNDKTPQEIALAIETLMLEDIRRLAPEDRSATGVTEAVVAPQVQQMITPWFRSLIAMDPAPALEKVRCPVLAICGEKDIQVAAAPNLAGIKAALGKANNPDVTTQAYPGLNHLFQACETGAVAEYATLEETMNPHVLEDVSAWINERFAD